MKRIIAFWSLVFCALLVFGCRNEASSKISLGDKVGKIKLKKSDGKTIDLSKLKGVHVVVFWVPDHAASEDCMDDLADLMDKKRFKDVTVLAITRGKDSSEQKLAKKRFKAKKWPFTLVFDPDFKAAKHFGVDGKRPPLPNFFIISRYRRLRTLPLGRITGKIRNYSFEDMLALVVDGYTIPMVEFVPYSPRQDMPSQKLIGKKAPYFSVKSLKGRTLKPDQYKGKKNVVVVFWSPNCPHCRKELPLLRKFMVKYGEKYDVEAFTMVYKFDKNTSSETLKAMQDITVDFSTGMYSDKTIADKYNAHAVPTLYVINKQGVICEFLIGEQPNLIDVLVSIFKSKKRMKMK